MILSAILSFFGGTTFRMIWGEISAFLTARQDHRNELERMRLQAELDAAQHARNLEAIKVQADLQVKVIEVQAQAAVGAIEAGAWATAVADVGRATGIRMIDAWNAGIRPGVATWSLAMLTLGEFRVVTVSETVVNIASAALGIYLADRALLKRGK
jgi:hypothetical protein